MAQKHFAIMSFSESGKIEGSFHFRIVYGHKYHWISGICGRKQSWK